MNQENVPRAPAHTQIEFRNYNTRQILRKSYFG